MMLDDFIAMPFRETKFRLSLGLFILITFDLCYAVPSHSAVVLHYRALELRGGDGQRGRRILDNLKPINQTNKVGNTMKVEEAAACVEEDPSSNVPNVTRVCSLRRNAPQNSCSMLPGAERRAQMAHLAGPPGRTPLKKTVNNFFWRISDWLGVTGTSTRVISKFSALQRVQSPAMPSTPIPMLAVCRWASRPLEKSHPATLPPPLLDPAIHLPLHQNLLHGPVPDPSAREWRGVGVKQHCRLFSFDGYESRCRDVRTSGKASRQAAATPQQGTMAQRRVIQHQGLSTSIAWGGEAG
jgi:hypothetical protein